MAIDTIFPIILILIGLWLATLSIYHDGAPRTVSPEAIYPPTTMYYNQKSKSMTSAKVPDGGAAVIKGFVEDIICKSNTSYYTVG